MSSRRAEIYRQKLVARGLLDPIRMITQGLGISPYEIFEKKRTAKLVKARVFVYEYLRSLGWSYPDIGELFEQDHTTVYKVLKQYQKREAKDFRVSGDQ